MSAPHPTWGGHSCLPWALSQPDVGRTFLSAEAAGRQECPPHTRRGADILVCLGLCLNPTWGGHSCLPKQQADKNVRPTPDVGRTFLSALGFVSTRRGADIPVCRSRKQTGMSAPRNRGGKWRGGGRRGDVD